MGAEPGAENGQVPVARRLAPLVVPALLVGIGSALVLLAVDATAELVHGWVWTALPGAFGVDGRGRPWTVAVLTLTGLAVGLVVWKAPGHAGPDPATVELVEEPLEPRVLPGLLTTIVLALACGVSLGPENPVIATTVTLAHWAGRRLIPAAPAATWVGLATAATVGALFSTPVAAALLLTEAAAGEREEPLWNRLVLPLIAAGSGAVTTYALAGPELSLSLPAYPGPAPGDVLSGSVIALAGGAAGLALVYAFPVVHGWFRRLRHPVLMVGAGGLVLGLLGALGGPLTMFKGLEEMKELADRSADLGVAALAVIIVVRMAALLTAASCGFRGGRIFPALFAGVALGLLVAKLVPVVPVSLAVACAVLGILTSVTRQGWLSLFIAVTVVPDLGLLPVLCLAVLPVWLLVSGRPEMVVAAQADSEQG
ncbi:ion channel protein [Nocardiopsis sp. EMB25]|uniref:ion channel protein n=1 Tax=Nocardiopsis sp. EMB25 TaxID=2835867 RepID=UPI0022845AD8|nr:ion channel protein [Nocardiopsis sp. EMB25]MCY9783978.1 ion channel protein [Nocardiopsis sp. EMB25]